MVLHGDEQGAVIGDTEVEHGRNVGMVKRGDSAGFAGEAPPHRRVLAELGPQQLQGHHPFERVLDSAVDVPGASGAETLEDFVFSNQEVRQGHRSGLTVQHFGST